MGRGGGGYAVSQGSYQLLANDHVLVGHGATPKIEEYDANGAIVMRARFGYDNPMMSYRAFRSAWTARASRSPHRVFMRARWQVPARGR